MADGIPEDFLATLHSGHGPRDELLKEQLARAQALRKGPKPQALSLAGGLLQGVPDIVAHLRENQLGNQRMDALNSESSQAAQANRLVHPEMYAGEPQQIHLPPDAEDPLGQAQMGASLSPALNPLGPDQAALLRPPSPQPGMDAGAGDMSPEMLKRLQLQGGQPPPFDPSKMFGLG